MGQAACDCRQLGSSEITKGPWPCLMWKTAQGLNAQGQQIGKGTEIFLFLRLHSGGILSFSSFIHFFLPSFVHQLLTERFVYNRHSAKLSDY